MPSTVVSVKNHNGPGGLSVRVVSQKVVEGGRELFPNGADDIPPGETQDFIIHAGQTLAILELPAEADTTPVPEAASAADAPAAAPAAEVKP